jgi:cytoskeleton protein RodZ
MGGQAGGDPRTGIGARLRAARERKGYTVLQAAEKMHVDPKMLDALEGEDFEALGAPVYVRGHLKHYAELIDEQSSELQGLYSNSIRAGQPDLTRIPKAEPQSDPRRLTAPAAVVIVVFAFAGVVWWVLSVSKGHIGGTRRQPVAAEAPKLVAPGAGPRNGHERESEAPAAATPEPVSVTAPAKPSTQAAQEPPSAGQAAGLATPAGDGASRPPSRPAELTLKFSTESWAEVYDAAGERLFYDVGPANSVKTFKGTAPLRIVLGNAPGVVVQVNGHVADLASVTHSDGTAQFSLTRSGRASEAKR